MSLKRRKITVPGIFKIAFLLFVVFITAFPFLYMLAVSFSEDIYVIQNAITFYPKGFHLGIYKLVFEDARIFVAYKNTIIYVVVGTIIALIVTTTGAYALSKRGRCPFSKTINTMLLITMFFGGGMIPAFLAINWLGIYDTIWAVVLPPALSAWNLILMRTFFMAFPAEIEESGRIDGLNDIGVLWYLVLPTSGAIIATIGLFYAVGLWNSFMAPLLYLKDSTKYPLQVVLRQILLAGSSSVNTDVILSSGGQTVPENSLKYAIIIVSIVPIIAVYPFLQKYFVKGVMIGSIKG